MGRQPLAELEEIHRLVVLLQELVEQVRIGVLAEEVDMLAEHQAVGTVFRRCRARQEFEHARAWPPAEQAAHPRTCRYGGTSCPGSCLYMPAGIGVVADVADRSGTRFRPDGQDPSWTAGAPRNRRRGRRCSRTARASRRRRGCSVPQFDVREGEFLTAWPSAICRGERSMPTKRLSGRRGPWG